MQIERMVLLVAELNKTKSFYQKYFRAQVAQEFYDDEAGSQGCLLKFSNQINLELLQGSGRHFTPGDTNRHSGYIRLAISVGSGEMVESLTKAMVNDGFECVLDPKPDFADKMHAIVLDPDGNEVELLAE